MLASWHFTTGLSPKHMREITQQFCLDYNAYDFPIHLSNHRRNKNHINKQKKQSQQSTVLSLSTTLVDRPPLKHPVSSNSFHTHQLAKNKHRNRYKHQGVSWHCWLLSYFFSLVITWDLACYIGWFSMV